MVRQGWQILFAVTSALQSRVPRAIERVGQAEDFVGDGSHSPSVGFAVVDDRARTG